MNAVVMHEAGPPDVLQLEKREIPKVVGHFQETNQELKG